MTNQHPITPPPELVEQLRSSPGTWLYQITNAYQAGADMELEACCQWLSFQSTTDNARDLRNVRRPKPPSLKEQALDALNLMLMFVPPGDQREQGETIRRALDALDD